MQPSRKIRGKPRSLTLLLGSVLFLVFFVSGFGTSYSFSPDSNPSPLPTTEPDIQRPLQINGVIGSENRIKVADVHELPYRMILKLESKFPDFNPDQVSHCTGWFAGPHTIITAGHCVYSAGDGGWATEVKIWFEMDNDGTQDWEYFYTDSTTVNGGSGCSSASTSCGPLRKASQYTSSEDIAYDYGGIILGDDQMGNLAGWLIADSPSDPELESRVFTISGYPNDPEFDSYKAYGTQWWHSGEAVSGLFSWSAEYLYYYIDTSGGQSGSLWR